MRGRELFASSAFGQMGGDFVTQVSDSVPWRVMVSPLPHDQLGVTDCACVKVESKRGVAAQISDKHGICSLLWCDGPCWRRWRGRVGEGAPAVRWARLASFGVTVR